MTACFRVSQIQLNAMPGYNEGEAEGKAINLFNKVFSKK
jgi:hypothetical protein